KQRARGVATAGAAGEGQAARPRNYGRWRALSLLTVYLLMAAHVIHWKLAGRTLAPLELHEVMFTLELGIVTAGFLFMAAAFLSAAIFGRFFCSWGCHILALEDACAWLLGRMGIEPKPFRSRFLRLVPSVALIYMFVWPHVKRITSGGSFPGFRIQTDAEGWASFATSDFWRNLPPVSVALLTFAVCGFAVVYFLGSRGFCAYGCPYGVLFGLADRLAPGRIVVAEGCAACGHCTDACQSGVLVHEETQAHGRVVDSACLKDLDCVAACPSGVLSYGRARPAGLLRSLRREAAAAADDGLPSTYAFSPAEDLAMAAVFVPATGFLAGAHFSLLPVPLCAVLGALCAWLTVMCVRLLRGQDVAVGGVLLKRSSGMTGAGAALIVAACLATAGWVHSAALWRDELAGSRALGEVQRTLESTPQGTVAADSLERGIALEMALRRLERASRLSLFAAPQLHWQLACLHGLSGGQLDGATARRLLNGERGDQDRVLLEKRLHGEYGGQQGTAPSSEGDAQRAIHARAGLAHLRQITRPSRS
ncbi:MAG: 4Fe-4S binding protein, partial [Planctomycetota bacterium]|nr:4Fe-4S binding protein [Planctomycetota bacterium]